MNLLLQALTGNYEPHGDEAGADAILAFAFGRSEYGPGRVNVAIADYAIAKAKETGLEILAQMTVADAIESRKVSGIKLTRIDPDNNKETIYMNTRHVLNQAKRAIGIDRTVMVVAQAFHAPRADRETKKFGYKTVLPEGLPRAWDPQSIVFEIHCRSPLLWRLREPFIILINKLVGRI